MADLIKVLVVDDHLVVRQGLAALLVPRNGMQVVGQAADGIEGVRKALALRPDVILMDLVMPKQDGIEATKAIKAKMPEARILILTSFGEGDKVQAAVRAGALGYLLKTSSADELFHAIHSIAMGKMTLPQEIAIKLIQEPQRPPNPGTPEKILTNRETDVLRRIAQGYSNQEIAEILCISTTTVRSHVSSLLRKLKLTNRTQAALYAIEVGLVDHHDTQET